MQNIKNILRTILVAIVIVLLSGYLAVTAVMDLTNKQDLQTVNLVFGTEFLEIEHSINGLIPIGTDYYYLGIDEDYNAYTILAGKHWEEENFSDFDPDSEDYKIVEITGLVKKISDYDVSREIQSTAEEELADMFFPLGATQCLELNYIKDAWMRLLAGVLLLIISIVGFAARKLEIQTPKIATIIFSVVLILEMILLLNVL
ncbi:MAG: hypothetical protein K2J71_06125 [Oscillospiraceae bacterium]|nr:hypothetical protein [Oscillospiraceae bacterium]